VFFVVYLDATRTEFVADPVSGFPIVVLPCRCANKQLGIDLVEWHSLHRGRDSGCGCGWRRHRHSAMIE